MQLDPSEDDWWSPGDTQQLLEVEGLVFGMSICHEGFRYPETVRWAARQGANVVFHPHFSGGNKEGIWQPIRSPVPPSLRTIRGWNVPMISTKKYEPVLFYGRFLGFPLYLAPEVVNNEGYPIEKIRRT